MSFLKPLPVALAATFVACAQPHVPPHVSAKPPPAPCEVDGGQLVPLPEVIVRVVPLPKLPSNRVTHLAAGAAHTCASFDDGTIACWGGGGENRPHVVLGPPNSVAKIAPPSPRLVVDLAAYEDRTCASFTDGAMACWSTNDAAAAPIFPEGHKARALYVGAQVCALLDDEHLHCWSKAPAEETASDPAEEREDSSTRLGTFPGGPRNRAHGPSHQPPSVAPKFSPCAIVRGVVTCDIWPSMQAIPLPRKAKALSASGDETCALLVDGSVTCWSRGWYCDRFDPLPEPDRGPAEFRTVPLPPGRKGALRNPLFRSATNRSCLLLEEGSLACWKKNRAEHELSKDDFICQPEGQAAQPQGSAKSEGADADRLIHLFKPTARPGLVPRLCAGMGDRSLRCWEKSSGRPLNAQDCADEIASDLKPPAASLPASARRPGGPGTAESTLDASGYLEVIPAEAFGPNRRIVEIAVGDAHTCVRVGPDARGKGSEDVSARGEIFCWGDNDEGQLGVELPEAGRPTPETGAAPRIWFE